jgi:hypothetical protein
VAWAAREVRPVSGDAVRNARFFNQAGGYVAADVDNLLRQVEEGLDVGRPAGPLIENAAFRVDGYGWEYDADAVEWFLDQLLRREDDPKPGGIGADPWRDLTVVNQFTWAGPGVLDGRPGGLKGRARRKYWNEAWTCLERECAEAWRDFGQLPGMRLRWERPEPGRRELRTAEQQPLADVRRLRLPGPIISAGGRSFQLKAVPPWSRSRLYEVTARAYQDYRCYAPVTASRPESSLNVLAGLGRGHFYDRGAELVDETGAAVLYVRGRHDERAAGACIAFPDQRWLRFPVRGTKPTNAIMTAVDQARNKVARYRLTSSGTGWPTAMEITLHPDRQLTDDLVLALAISARWIGDYFEESGGGG